MHELTFMLQIAALVCFLFGALSLFPNARLAWGWAGLFLWCLSFMLGGVSLHQAPP